MGKVLVVLVAATAAVVYAMIPAGTGTRQAAAATPRCQATKLHGLTAAVVNPTRTVTGTVHATGCDVGIYVSPGRTAHIVNASISGAKQYGLLVNDGNAVIQNMRASGVRGAPVAVRCGSMPVDLPGLHFNLPDLLSFGHGAQHMDGKISARGSSCAVALSGDQSGSHITVTQTTSTTSTSASSINVSSISQSNSVVIPWP